MKTDHLLTANGCMFECLGGFKKDNTVVHVLYSGDAQEEGLYESTCATMLVKGEPLEYAAIFLADEFIMCYPKYVQKGILLHELAHVTIPEASAKGFKSEDEYIEARIEAIESGKVLLQELTADKYMAKNLTNEELIDYISFWRKHVKYFHDNIDKFKIVLSEEEFICHELKYNELEIRMNVLEQFV